MSSAEELMSKQQRTVKAALELQKKTDPKELLEGAARIQEMAKDLEKSAKRLEAEFAGVGGAEERVVLTADQRERLAESTGVAMETLVVVDRDGAFARKMPTTDRATIERMAARQAGVIATRKAKEKATEELIKRLEKLDLPELAPVIASIRKDPSLGELTQQQLDAAEELKAKHAGTPPG